MSFELGNWLTTTALCICIVAVGVGYTGGAKAHAETYPWCTQGDILNCYYMNREQCEQTVDYHGFCVPNPDYRQNTR